MKRQAALAILAVLLAIWSGHALAQGIFDLDQMRRDIYGPTISSCRYGQISTPGDMPQEKRIDVCTAMIKQRIGKVPRIRPEANTVTDLAADELAIAYASRADGYAKLEKYDLALADMQSAVAVIENYFLANKTEPLSLPTAWYYLSRGIAFERIGNLLKANSDFFTCIHNGLSKHAEVCVNNIVFTNAKLKEHGIIDRDNARYSMLALQFYGKELGKKSDYQTALNTFNTALRLAPLVDDPNLEASLLYFRGITFWRMKNNARAGGDLNRCVTLSTDAALSARCQDLLSKI
ncbi:tetratricopeptide repeat protein [Xanthobacter wiegelii]|uniref:hypothetical protein n=1 Tax=Xanthobacter wiegelii TaxID=3119913 RepID=UPI0037268DFE